MKNILFDLDGPILDVKPKYFQIYSTLLTKYGFPYLPEHEYWDLKRGQISEAQILERTGATQVLEIYSQERMALIESKSSLSLDRVQPGMKTVLDQLYQRYHLVLVTLRSHRQALLWELEDKDLKKYFATVLSGDFHLKPRWKNKFKLLHESGIKKECCLCLVGDTDVEIASAREFGIPSVAVCSGLRSKELLKNLKPDYLVEESVGVYSVIKALAQAS